MKQPVPLNRRIIVNTAGTFGYGSCLLQWLWTAIIFVPLFLKGGVKDFLLPTPTAVHTEPVMHNGSSPLTMIVAIVVTSLVLLITVLIVVRLPAAVAKTGRKVTVKTAGAVLPVVTHHQKVTPQRRKLLTARLVKIIKFILVLLPLLLLGFVGLFDAPLPEAIVFTVGGLLAAFSFLWFSLQYGLAKWLRVSAEDMF